MALFPSHVPGGHYCCFGAEDPDCKTPFEEWDKQKPHDELLESYPEVFGYT